LANLFVYCVGADGHSAVEQAHATAASCSTSGGSTESGRIDIAPNACTDLPLLVQTSKEAERFSDTNPLDRLVVTALVSVGLPTAAQTTFKRTLSLIPRDTTSLLRITVLQV